MYKKTPDGKEIINNPSEYLISYLESQGIIIPKDILVKEVLHESNDEDNFLEDVFDDNNE